jgi:hypothetical protein
MPRALFVKDKEAQLTAIAHLESDLFVTGLAISDLCDGRVGLEIDIDPLSAATGARLL